MSTNTTTLTAAQTAVMDVIRVDLCLSMEEIVAKVGTTPRSIAPVLKKLEEKGLILRDREVGTVTLTETTEPVTPITEDDIDETVAAITANPEAQAPVDSPDDAIDKARMLQKAEAEFEVTKAGTHAKVITVGKAYVTTDGKFVAAKIGSDKKNPWVLLSVPEGKKRPAKVGAFKSSSAALLLEVLNPA